MKGLLFTFLFVYFIISGAYQLTDAVCLTWYNRCTGIYYCRSDSPREPNCTIIIPQSLAPPPSSKCVNTSGLVPNTTADDCQFVNPCKAWNKECYGVDYQCTLLSEYIQYNKTHPKCDYYFPPPPPKQQCIYINDTCTWYNGCGQWMNECDGVYQCGNLINKYLQTHQKVQLKCHAPLPPALVRPPGECVDQSDLCTWSECHSWLDWCEWDWLCGSLYDYQVYMTTPPHPCPSPPSKPLPQPGVCQYNFTSQKCQFDKPLELNCSFIYNDCTGHYTCSPSPPPPLPPPSPCHTPLIPQHVAPPSHGTCTALADTCIHYDTCVAWYEDCYGGFQCTLLSEYLYYNKTHSPCFLDLPLPPPNRQCLYINNTCTWYDGECGLWADKTNGVYQCGTVIDKYRNTHTKKEESPPLSTSTVLPPGECIYQLGNCTWSDCRAWIDVCQRFWSCGDGYDQHMFWSQPYGPPCPPPPHKHVPQPGPCLYNMNTGKCQFNSTVITDKNAL